LKKSVLIVAGGSGLRMKNKTPKQFLPLAGKPLLFHTITAFYNYANDIEIILVLPENQIEEWNNLCREYNFNIHHCIVKGGKTRFNSVKNGLHSFKSKGLIGVHDGVRPLVSKTTISKVYDTAEKSGAAVPVIPVSESLRKLKGKFSKSLLRENIHIVQTPQCFKSDVIRKAYRQKFNAAFTDDASVVEKYGFKIKLVEGNPENIKITNPLDMVIAACLFNHLSS